MTTPLICDRCGKEIEIGTPVVFIDPNGDPEPRILLDSLVVHEVCPE
jgi:hypothetical protein